MSRQVFLDALVDGGISHSATDRMMDVVFQEYPNASMDQLKKVQNDLEKGWKLEGIVGAYLDQTVKAIADHQPVAAPAGVEDEISSIVSDALVKITDVMGKGSSDELKKKVLEESRGINKAVSAYVQEVTGNFRSGSMHLLVMAYWLISSQLSRIICIAGIILIFAVLFFLKRRLLSVIDSCKWPIVLSGLFLGVLAPLTITGAWRLIANRFLGGRVEGLNASKLAAAGMILIVIGVVLFVISFLAKKRMAKD